MNRDDRAGPYALRFDARCADAFMQVSYDHNPLHCDPVYARKTPFGVPIMFGVGVVLGALGRVFCDRRLSIKSIKAVFLRSVIAERTYTVESTVKAGDYVITVSEANRVHVRVKLALRADRVAPRGPHPSDMITPRLTEPTPATMRYALNWQSYIEFCRCFDLSPELLPPLQINALLWASYLVGMVYPGEQALLSDLELAFDAEPGSGSIDLRRIEYESDERYPMVQVAGVGTGIPRFVLHAMRRPLPVRYAMSDIREALAADRRTMTDAAAQFSGKRIMVTGGSRGLGSIFARGFAALGAVVIAGCRYQSDDAEAVAADLTQLNPASGVLVADLADVSAFRGAAESVSAGGRLDCLVCGASPVIQPAAFSEMQADDIAGFIGYSLRLFLTPLHALLPLVVPGGRIIVISSAYCTSPEANFAHYVAAKKAIEGLTEGVAKEHPATEFIIFRPPRFLSDQTNTVLAQESLPSAIDIFRGFMAKLLEGKCPAVANVRYLEL